MDDFRQKLALALDTAGLSRTRLARLLKVDKSVVSRWVSGATRPSDHNLDRLTEVLAGRLPGFSLSAWQGSVAAFAAGLRAAPQEPPTDLSQQVSFLWTADRVRLAVAELGTGPVLVKGPNWLNHVEYDLASPIWGPMFRRLAATRRFVRYDGRGNGLSDWAVETLSFEALVSDLETVIDNLKVERVALLGLSQGAAVAVAYAARHPDKVSHLLLHGGFALGRNRQGSVAEIERARLFNALIAQGWGKDSAAFLKAFATVYMPNATEAERQSFMELQRVSASAENAIRLRHLIDDIDVSATAAQVRSPTLVMHARNDQVVPAEQGRQLAASIPGARFLTLDSDNHVILPGEAAWPRFMAEIEAFLQR